MARTVKPLTDTQIKQAKPKEKEYSLSDGYGLQLIIKPSGTKNWIFKYYKPFTKKRTNLSFGKYPHITLAEARQKREEANSLLAKDIDPKEHRDNLYQQESQARLNTLEKVIENWFEVKKSSVSAGYAEKVMSALNRHIIPALGKRPIDSIDAPLAIATLKPIAAKGSLETVKRLCQKLNEIMTYAVNTGIIHHNPLTGIKSAFSSPKTEPMKTIPTEELPEFLEKLSRASIKFTTRCLIEWQLHTMTRPNEAAKAKWDEIDFKNKVWNIPASRMKVKREHRVPLSPYAMKLLRLMEPVSHHREYIFPADREPKNHTNTQTANAAIKRMGYGGRLVAHGLRALASTTINNHQLFDPILVEVALAHQEKNEVKAAYNRADYLEKRREMMCWWSDYITNSRLNGIKEL